MFHRPTLAALILSGSVLASGPALADPPWARGGPPGNGHGHERHEAERRAWEHREWERERWEARRDDPREAYGYNAPAPGITIPGVGTFIPHR